MLYLLNEIYFVLFYILLCVLLRLHKNWLPIGVELIFVIISCIVLEKPHIDTNIVFNYFAMTGIGFLISPIIVYISYIVFFGVSPKINLKRKLNWELFYEAAREEFIWRFIAVMWCKHMQGYILFKIILAILISFIFVMAHPVKKGLKDVLEMLFFSCILMLTEYYTPGINLGLHFGRNNMCYNAKDEK